ncbi:uncharacterized protein LOC144652254 [Oculina patagonica]
MAGVPSVASTKETTNYARLCRLLVDIGSQALRDTFDGIHAPATLHTVLASHPVRTSLQDLFRRKKILNPAQWGKLYPAIASSVSSLTFDITLLMVLLRNICGLTPPATGWDALPPDTDKSREADIARLKYFRNTVYAHAEQARVDDVTYNTHWQNIRDVLVRLGGAKYGDAIDTLKTECMDPVIEEHYKELLQQWKKDEYIIKDQLQEMGNDIKEMGSDVKCIKEMGNDIKYIKEALRMAIDKAGSEDIRTNRGGEKPELHPSISSHESNEMDTKEKCSERQKGDTSSHGNIKETNNERNEAFNNSQPDFRSSHATAPADQNTSRPPKLSVSSKKTGNVAADTDDSSSGLIKRFVNWFSYPGVHSECKVPLRNNPNTELVKFESGSDCGTTSEAQPSRSLYQRGSSFTSTKEVGQKTRSSAADTTSHTAEKGEEKRSSPVPSQRFSAQREEIPPHHQPLEAQTSSHSSKNDRQTEVLPSAQAALSQASNNSKQGVKADCNTCDMCTLQGTSICRNCFIFLCEKCKEIYNTSICHVTRRQHDFTVLKSYPVQQSKYARQYSKGVKGDNTNCELCALEGTITCRNCPLITCRKCKQIYEIDFCNATKGDPRHAFVDLKDSKLQQMKSVDPKAFSMRPPGPSSKNDLDAEASQGEKALQTDVKRGNAICDMCLMEGTITCANCPLITCRKCKQIYEIDFCNATKGDPRHAFVDLKDSKLQ